ncbi:MAG: DUF2085 domain-containing protein [Calditrichaeota bacterium]|nr:DUF2085 domain-containing protein [Calditrichota bacterium]
MEPLSRKQELIYYIFLVGVILWCGLILLAPYLASRGHSFSSGMIYFFFSKVCHQMASRSFFIFGHQLAVCSRCTGIYFGFFASTLFFFLLIKMKKFSHISPRVLLVAVFALIFDFAVGFTGVGNNTMTSRFVTGFLTGAIALFFVLPGALELGKKLSTKNKK